MVAVEVAEAKSRGGRGGVDVAATAAVGLSEEGLKWRPRRWRRRVCDGGRGEAEEGSRRLLGELW